MTKSPRVVLGLPAYNSGPYFAQTLESLLSQTFGDFCLIVTDDSTSRETETVCLRYATKDPRVVYHRNPRRLGMCANWRRSLELASERWPEVEYFAWVTDHDLWHPRWLESVIRELEEHPEAVASYSYSVHISENGEIMKTLPWYFETAGKKDVWDRFSCTVMNMSASDMYGLFRRKILRTEMLSEVLLPDRLFQSVLALYGQTRQVLEILYFKRFGGHADMGRQRRGMYPGQPLKSLFSYLPWWISHVSVLVWNYGVMGIGLPFVSKRRAFKAAGIYLKMTMQFMLRRLVRRNRDSFLEILAVFSRMSKAVRSGQA